MPKRQWFEVSALAEGDTTAEVAIYDVIGESWWGDSVSARDFLTTLAALPKSVMQINLRVNSPGGDMFDGIAISNMLARHPANVVATIDGLAASAASIVVMGANRVVMPENAFLMIHDPSMVAMGGPEVMQSAADDLSIFKAGLIATYARRTGLPDDQLGQMLSDETWLTAERAVELKFADEVIPATVVRNVFDLGLYRSPPAALVRAEETDPAADPPGDQAETGDPADPAPAVGDPPADPAAVTDPAAAPADPAAAGPSNVVRLPVAAPTAAEVVDLCKSNGMPQLAGELIRDQLSLDDCRKAIQNAKADAAGPEISTHQPQPTLSGAAANAALSDEWANLFRRARAGYR